MNLMRGFKQLVVCCTLVQATGCAAIFIPARQKVTINTDRGNSTVYVDNVEAGQGETVVTKVKKDGVKQVVVQTPGYKDSYSVLVQDRRHAAFWPLYLLDVPFFLGMVLDANAIPKFFRFAPTSTHATTQKYANKGKNEKYVELEAIKLTVADKNKDLKDYFGVSHSSSDLMSQIEKAERSTDRIEERIEAKNARKKKSRKTLQDDDKKIDYDDTKFSETVYKTMKKTGYVDTVNKVFQDNNATLGLEGIIKQARVYHINGKAYSSYKKAKVNITWNIKNSFGEKLDSISEWSYSGDFTEITKDKGEKMFADAVENSYLNLFKNKRFTRHLQLDTVFSIKDPVLSLTLPKSGVMDVSEAAASTVTVKREDGGHGTGFAITNDGYILTNFHVIAGKTFNKLPKLTVLTSSGEELQVTVVRYNRMRDLALLKVSKTFDKAFILNNPKSFKNLMEVYTIGTPKSIELGQSVSLGLISNERKTPTTNMLQLSMSVNSGNSGGPLFEKNGTLHGVITSKLVGFGTEGVGFAIPSYLVPAYLNLSFN